MAFSLENKFVIANYHYVENPRPDFSGIHSCSVAEFDRQVAFLAERYRFVSVSELFAAAKNNDKEKLCTITFDDGLRDQEIYAVPILKKYNAPATFFIITGTLGGRVPIAHKIHTVLSRMSTRDLLKQFNTFLVNKFPEEVERLSIPTERRVTERRRHDDMISANVKETFAIAPVAITHAFLTDIFAHLDIDESALARELFMAREGIAALAKQGYCIESHTHDHYAWSVLSADDQRVDLQASAKVFADILGRGPTVMAYPYGRWPEHDDVLKEHGFIHAVTVESRNVVASDKSLRIPRFDTNDIKIFLDAIYT